MYFFFLYYANLTEPFSLLEWLSAHVTCFESLGLPKPALLCSPCSGNPTWAATYFMATCSLMGRLSELCLVSHVNDAS